MPGTVTYYDKDLVLLLPINLLIVTVSPTRDENGNKVIGPKEINGVCGGYLISMVNKLRIGLLLDDITTKTETS